MTKEYQLLCLGNPLLDIQVNGDQALLNKYGLKPNDAILAEEKYLPIYEEITALSPRYVAGGAAQNACRGAQYVLPPKSTVYVGCVGKDAYADQLVQACSVKGGVRTEYRIEEAVPTGKCAVIITGYDRSMVTDLGAANHYKLEHLKSEKVWALVENANIFYVEGYRLTVCVPAILALAEHAAATNKVFSMNLSAPFLCQFFKDAMDQVIPYLDYLIGNESEALAYSESHNWGITDITEITKKLANLPKVNTSRPRHVVITQGTEPTIVAKSAEHTVQTYPVRQIDPADIVDTNGAGDAFAGGFLGGLVKGEDLPTCVDMGQWLASLSIREFGPAFPDQKQVYTKA
ncbi:adenosine kinase-like protein [Terfezia boudieri ATCC MYA-4762]|uniref:Adenosine kinase n=1 Tax=Terfezia boudieri ATCC MYA-4762 TaxID=1051890 RepID=A0A3N4LVR5_9PEZI|nr:adenosine kinase-like protein [Terfezia boudieri ATCC MYA-4762]